MSARTENNNDILSTLENLIQQRKNSTVEESYVAQLLHANIDKVLKKIGEEATEVVIAGKSGDKNDIIYESADLIFHLLVLLGRENIPLAAILTELSRRLGISGLTEKAQRQES